MGKELTIDTFSQNFCGLEALDRCQQLLGCQCSFALPCRSYSKPQWRASASFSERKHTFFHSTTGRGPLVDSPLIPCRRKVVFLKCGIFLARAIIFPCRGVHCLSVDVGLPMFRTVVAGTVAFPSTCSATDVTIYFLDWSCRSVPLLQVCRLGEKFSSLSRSTFLFEVYTLPWKGMCALVEGVLLDRRGEERGRGCGSLKVWSPHSMTSCSFTQPSLTVVVMTATPIMFTIQR